MPGLFVRLSGTMLGLHCCSRAFSSCAHRLLIALASLDVEHRLQWLQLMGLSALGHVGFSQTRDQTCLLHCKPNS